MNPKLRNMIFLVGTVTLGGLGFALFTPVPAARTMAELRDGGIADGQKFVLVCPERLTPQTVRRINRNQPGQLRPKQRYATVARVAVCFGRTLNDGGVGNCFRPDGGLAPNLNDGEGEVVVPSLRRDLVGAVDDGGIDDAGEDTSVDDSYQYRLDGCEVKLCTQDAGSPFANQCGQLNRLWLVAQPCVIPNCWVGDGGGWVDDAVVNCKRRNPPPFGDGGFRWAGCNVMPASESSGPACLPSSCDVVAGDNPWDSL